MPFQSSIRASMLLQAAPRARSSLCGESATMIVEQLPPLVAVTAVLDVLPKNFNPR
jgi:hypothetical protein